jgi:hypothetical protein
MFHKVPRWGTSKSQLTRKETLGGKWRDNKTASSRSNNCDIQVVEEQEVGCPNWNSRNKLGEGVD